MDASVVNFKSNPPAVLNSPGSVLTKAHKQWANRPKDERKQSLEEQIQAAYLAKKESMEFKVSIDQMVAEEHPDHGLVLKGPSGGRVAFTNWSFQQLCALIKAPAHYLPSISNRLAVDCLNEGLQSIEKTVQVLVRQSPGQMPVLRAINGNRYARVWDYNSLTAIEQLIEGGNWKLPPAYKDGQWGAELVPTGAYIGDRSSFLFMVDESRPMEILGRQMNRGFFFWNSEVGAGTIGMDLFIFDRVCGNHYVFGGTVIASLRKKHIGKALNEIAHQKITLMLDEYSKCSLDQEEATIRKAATVKLDGEPIEILRNKGFAKHEAEGGVAAAIQEEGKCDVVWDAVMGLTAYARSYSNMDDRTDLQYRAGKLLETVK